MRELTHLRTRFSKHFASEPGKNTAQISATPVHYLTPDDAWDDVSNLVKSVDGGWVAATKEVRFGIEGGYLTISRNGHALQMRPTAIGMVDRTAPATRWRKLADASFGTVENLGSGVLVVRDIFPNTDLTVTITEDSMAKSFTVRERPTLPDPTTLGWNAATTYLVVVWDVQKPAGVTVRDTVSQAVVGNGYVGNNDLAIEDPQGTAVVTFKAGVGTSAIGRKNPVWYISAGANVPFGEAFAYEKAAIATYPVELDPTVVVAPSSSIGTVSVDGTYEGTFYWGDDSWSDKDGSGGGPDARGFCRFDLTGISGTATVESARFGMHTQGAPYTDTYAGGGCYITKLDADWWPISVDDRYAAGTQVASQPHPSSGYVVTTPYAGNSVAAYGSTVAYCSGTNIYWTTGTTWSGSSTGYSFQIATNGSIWVLADNATGRIYSTTNFTTRTLRMDPAAVANMPRLKYTNGAFYSTAQYGSAYSTLYIRIDRSTDGISWSTVYTGPARSGVLGGVLWNGSEYVQFYRNWTTDAAGFTAKIGVLTSSDGINWSVLTSDIGVTANVNNAPSSYYDAACTSSRYVVLAQATDSTGANARTYTSTSLTSGWTSVAGTSGPYKNVVAVGDAFVGSPSYGSSYLKHSTDGTTWQDITFAIQAWSSTGLNVAPDTSNAIAFTYRTDMKYVLESGALQYAMSSEWADLTDAAQSTLGGILPLRLAAWTPTGAGVYYTYGPTLQVTYTTATGPTWVSPTDATNIPPNTSLVWTSVVDASPVHFQLDMASDSGFTTNKVSKRSFNDSGFEYWDGTAWQTLTSAGMPANKTGNQVRYTPSGQDNGTFYRRVRQGK